MDRPTSVEWRLTAYSGALGCALSWRMFMPISLKYAGFPICSFTFFGRDGLRSPPGAQVDLRPYCRARIYSGDRGTFSWGCGYNAFSVRSQNYHVPKELCLSLPLTQEKKKCAFVFWPIRQALD